MLAEQVVVPGSLYSLYYYATRYSHIPSTSSEGNLRCGERGVDRAPFDGREGHGRVRRVLLNIRWRARVCRASTTGDTGCAWILGGWVWSIQPQHVDCVVIPDGQDENHSLLEGGTHCCKASLDGKLVSVTECSLLGGAERVGDGVSGDPGDISIRVGDDDSVLDVETLNLAQGARGSTILSQVSHYSLILRKILHTSVMNWVTTVKGLHVSTIKPEP